MLFKYSCDSFLYSFPLIDVRPHLTLILVMEDLRVLEQQQRDSQRLLASIKLTKQHKLEQRVSLESKMSTLKYSNGEARAQLLRARDVLSKSTRELGSAKIHSERSSDNLKRFDEKLKRTLTHVRGLNTKRRQVEQAIVKLRNEDFMVSQKLRAINDKMKTKEMDKDDASHRQKLLAKSIQTFKVKTQELVGDTMKMRSELSELERDLTTAQQMEASTKFRADGLTTEIEAQAKRHDEAKLVVKERIEILKQSKVEIKEKITLYQTNIDTKSKKLIDLFNECTRFQKEDGLELSSSPTSAAIDISRLRCMANEEESKCMIVTQEETAVISNADCLEKKNLELRKKISSVDDETEQLLQTVNDNKQKEQLRTNEHENLIAEFTKEQSEVENLRSIAAQFRKEVKADREVASTEEKEQLKLIGKTKENLVVIETEIALVEKNLESSKANLEEQKITKKSKTDAAKFNVSEKKSEFDEVQKEADSLASGDSDYEAEIVKIEENGKSELGNFDKERSELLAGKLDTIVLVFSSKITVHLCAICFIELRVSKSCCD